ANIWSFLEDLRARGFSPAGILDVGAENGSWTRNALSIYPQASVVMIEPQDEWEAVLSALCRERSACRYIKAGAGRAGGDLIQTIYDDLSGSSFMHPPDDTAIQTGRQRRTHVITINSILEQHKDFRPDLVKLDIQGFELEALIGGSNLFGTTEVFVVETSLFSWEEGWPITSEVISFMAHRNYEIYDITEFIRRPLDGALGRELRAAGMKQKDIAKELGMTPGRVS